MINLGLSRVRQLLARLGNPENHLKVFHVAGTNGKGSVCTYIESVLRENGARTGKFTSPHLLTPNDAISVDQRALARDEYDELVAAIARVSLQHGVQATEFEVQTAAAFAAFARHKIDVGIVEVGLGGTHDATNVLPDSAVLCSAITKIAVDHEGFLGSTLSDVAQHKAGIMRRGRPCVADASNSSNVLDVFRTHAAEMGAELQLAHSESSDFRAQNRAVAVAAIRSVFPDISSTVLDAGLAAAVWPGRLQWVRPGTLVDGAHNVSAAKELRRYVDTLGGPVKWIVAFSKPADAILSELVRPEDSVVATAFGSVEGMPWIRAEPASRVAALAQPLSRQAVQTAASVRDVEETDETTVVCGSLYLVAEYLRYLRET